MTRFRAINDSSSESDDDNEEKETKEAQEDRAFAQYNQGLRLHSEKKYGEAELIYAHLLESPFLEQITSDSVDGSDSLVRPAAALKYGCLKNLGEVLVIRGSTQEGLDCYLQALELDNSDVTMWHRAGKVALKVNRLDLASCAFQQALQCNARYWPSLDALIPVLYALGDTVGCLVLCCRTLQLDRGYPLARAFRARILKERPSLVEDLAAFDIDECDIKIGQDDDSEELVKIATDLQDLWRDSEKAFQEPKLSGIDDKTLTVTISNPSWLAVGKALLQLYRRISSSDTAVSFLNVAKLELASNDSAGNSKGSTSPNGGTAAPEGESDTDAEEQTEEDATEASGQEQEDPNKVAGRKRRRGSTSHFDPYKRRSARVRNGVRREQEKEDLSLADMLRSLLPPSLHITNIETESESEKRRKDVRRLADALAWGEDSDDAAVELCRLLEQREMESGQTQSRQNRHDVIAKKLKEEAYFGTEKESKDVQSFVQSDEGHIIVDLLSLFLNQMRLLGSMVWPVGLPRVFSDVYQYYRCHNHHLSPLNPSVTTEELKADAELTLLYSELFLDRLVQSKHSNATPCQLMEDGMTYISMLVGRPDIINSPPGRNLILRGMWIRVLYSLQKDDSPSAIHTLKEIVYFIENYVGEEDLKKKESPLPQKDSVELTEPVNKEEKTEKAEQLKGDVPSDEKPVKVVGTTPAAQSDPEVKESPEVIPADASSEVVPAKECLVIPAEASMEVVSTEEPINAGASSEIIPAETSPECLEEPLEESLEEFPVKITSEKTPVQSQSEVTPAETTSEVIPSKASSELNPAEVSSKIIPAEASLEVIPAETSSEKPKEDAESEVIPAEESSEIIEAEVSSKITPGEEPSEKAVEAPPEAMEVTPAETSERVSTDEKMEVDPLLSENTATTVKPISSEVTKDLKDLARIQSEFSVVLPNCINNYLINKMSAQRLLTSLTRKQQLKRMEQLYESGQFADLVDMLADCFKFCAQQFDNGSDSDEYENLPDRPTQMAMLLDSLWQLERYNDCVFWAEACLYEAHGRYLNISEENREQQQIWATVVENILIGLDKCLALSPTLPLKSMPPVRLSRLVQTLSSLLCHQLDQQDSADVAVECTTAWLLMYRVMRFEESNLREEDTYSIPQSLMMLFTAHDHMAKRGWCSQGEGRLLLAILDGVLAHLRRPELHAVREEITHQAEQAIFCLFKHPQKAKEQGRKRYLQEHKVPSQLTLTLDRAMQLLEFVRPDELPGFDFLPDQSIDTDCEVLLRRILQLIPPESTPVAAKEELRAYIKGVTNELPKTHYSLPPRATDLLYLLADFYFKRNVDKNKYDQAIRYYQEDICANPTRFDSWASMGLARSTKLTTKLNCCDRLNVDRMLSEMSDAKRCFLRALELDENNIIFIEFGSFAYCMHSYCSRLLKADPNDTNVDMFDEMLSQASKCFTTASKVVQDERWLPEYMLGKIAEKRGEEPSTFLRHYQMAAMLLDDGGAEYPLTLEYDSKRRLACEAHEVHYRIHASILKQLVHSLCRPIDSATYELYRCCLAKFAEGPFMKATKAPVPYLKDLLKVRGVFQPSAKPKAAKVRHAKRKSSEKSERSEKSRDGSAFKKAKIETEAGIVAVPKVELIHTEQPETGDESKPSESKPMDSKPAESPQTESKLAESLSVESAATDSKPTKSISTKSIPAEAASAESIPAEAASAENIPAETAPAESNPAESKPVECKLAESKSVESRLAESKPAESNPADNKPADSKPADNKPVECKPADSKPTESKPTESKPADSNPTETGNHVEPVTEVKTAPSTTATSASSSSSSTSGSSSDSDSSSGSSSGSSDSGSSSDSSDSDDSSDSSTADENKASRKADSENPENSKENTKKDSEGKPPERVKRTPSTEKMHDVGPLVRACLYAMEECLLRYPRHYKSLYRLAHYYYSPGEHRDLDKCWQLLLGKYHVERANRDINGLFKSDNFRSMFSDIWRIQSEEVDRAGSFAAHMSRSVLLVLQLLRDKRDHRRLIQLGSYLYKDPENARSKYLRDNERKELAQQAVEMCVMVMRGAVPETNTVDGLMEIYSTVHTALHVIQDLPRSTAETFRVFLCDAFKTVKDLKSTNYDAAFDFCKRERAQRKKQAAAEAAAAEAALQASLLQQIPPANTASSSSQGPASSSASPYSSSVTISKVPSNPLTPAAPRFPAPSTSWTGMPQSTPNSTGKVGRPKKPTYQPQPSSSGYGPGRMSVEQLLMTMGMDLNMPFASQQGMNLLAQMQQSQPSFRPQLPKPKPQPKVAPIVSTIGKDRPGISITPLQANAPRKPFNPPSRNQLVVEPVNPQGAGPSMPPWPTSARGRPPLHSRSAISVVPASRLMKSAPPDPSLAALSRLQGANQLQVTPRPRGRPPNPLNANRGRPRLNPPTQWPGMPLPMAAMAPGAANTMRPGRPAGPRAHAQAMAFARAQAYQDLEQVRAKAQYQLQQRQQMVRPAVTKPAAPPPKPAAPPAPKPAAPPAPAAASSAAALLDPEIITLE